MFYIVILKVEGKYYIMANKNGSITAFDTEQQALGFFEKSYSEAHEKGFEFSISAIHHRMTFRPSIIEVDDLNYIKEHIALSNKPTLYELAHKCGILHGLSTKVGADGFWKFGKKPKLYSEV